MRFRILAISVITILASFLVSGGTQAWFFHIPGLLTNLFTAGTLEIDAGGKEPHVVIGEISAGTVTFPVTNNGTKDARVRIGLEGEWTTGPIRMLMVYTGDSRQLLGIEWETYCQGCTGTTGPMATGSAAVRHNSAFTAYMFEVIFSSLTDPDTGQPLDRWLQNGRIYSGWCQDRLVTIGNGTYPAQVYDPHCNPNWHLEATTSSTLRARWGSIQFDKINYIINRDFRFHGFTRDEIQQAIWWYTNGSFHPGWPGSGGGATIRNYIEDFANLYGGGNMLTALNAREVAVWSLPAGSNWRYHETVNDKRYYYYDGVLAPGETVELQLNISTDSSVLDNWWHIRRYHGMEYYMEGSFEAVQASNHAPYYIWNVDIYGSP